MYNCLILAEWSLIGGKRYEFNPVGLTQSEASARCKRFGGKLFEPRDAKTNKNVFTQAGISNNQCYKNEIRHFSPFLESFSLPDTHHI